MKNKTLLVLALFIGVATAITATTYNKVNSRIARVQMDVTYDATFTPTKVAVTAFALSSFQNTVTPSDIVDNPTWQPVAFDLLDPTLASTNITAAGKTVTYPQLAALIRQAAMDRATAAGIQ